MKNSAESITLLTKKLEEVDKFTEELGDLFVKTSQKA